MRIKIINKLPICLLTVFSLLIGFSEKVTADNIVFCPTAYLNPAFYTNSYQYNPYYNQYNNNIYGNSSLNTPSTQYQYNYVPNDVCWRTTRKIIETDCDNVKSKVREITDSKSGKLRTYVLTNGYTLKEFVINGDNLTYELPAGGAIFYKSLFPRYLNVNLYKDKSTGLCRMHINNENDDPYVYKD